MIRRVKVTKASIHPHKCIQSKPWRCSSKPVWPPLFPASYTMSPHTPRDRTLTLSLAWGVLGVCTGHEPALSPCVHSFDLTRLGSRQLGIPETAHGPPLEYHQPPHGSSHPLTH